MLVGRSVADMLQSALEPAVLIGVGLAIGWRWHGGLGALLAAVGLLLLLRFAMLWIGIYLGLVAGRPELVQAVQILVWPVGFLSNVFAAPGVDARLARRDRRVEPAVGDGRPRSATCSATRGWGGDSWAAEHARCWPSSGRCC